MLFAIFTDFRGRITEKTTLCKNNTGELILIWWIDTDLVNRSLEALCFECLHYVEPP